MPKEKMLSLIEAAVILIIGILFCFERSMGIKLITTILGISVIVGGVVFLAVAIFGKKALLKLEGLIGAFLVSLGILFFDVDIFAIIIRLLTILLIAIGALLIGDGLLDKFVHYKDNLVMFLAKVILGIILITVGILLLTIESFRTYSAIVFGICLIIFAIYFMIATLVNKNPKTIDATK